MSEDERTLVMLGEALAKVARPHDCDDVIPVEVRTALWSLGVPCTDLTPRQELVARLWARKRNLLTAIQGHWGGPTLTPPSAA